MMAHNIGFFVHANCNWYGGKMHPIEVAFADVHTLEVLVTTVDNTDKLAGSSDEKMNKYCSRRIHRLPYDFQGRFSWDCVITWLKEEYRKRDNGFNLLVAVRGVQQMKIFQEANLPIVELGKEIHIDLPSYERLPSYEDDWGIDLDDDHWRLHRGTYRCSRRIAYAYSRYIKDRQEKEIEVKNQVFTFVMKLQNVTAREIVVEGNEVIIKMSTD